MFITNFRIWRTCFRARCTFVIIRFECTIGSGRTASMGISRVVLLHEICPQVTIPRHWLLVLLIFVVLSASDNISFMGHSF